jgi:hypothetical protein
MTSLTDLPELIGFFSYSREDDQDSQNALSTIRTLIQNELRARLGRSRQSLRLWQDQEAIAPGSMWESQINAAVQQSVFFIPIITPRVINSKYCGIEFKRFLDRERDLRRDDLVFPILYIDVDELQDESQWRGHPLLEVIGQRQYVDWREYRYESDSPTLRRAAANLCAKIATTLRRPQPNERIDAADSGASRAEANSIAREQAEQQRRNEEVARIRLVEEEKGNDRAKAKTPLLEQNKSLSDEERSRPELPKDHGSNVTDEQPALVQENSKCDLQAPVESLEGRPAGMDQAEKREPSVGTTLASPRSLKLLIAISLILPILALVAFQYLKSGAELSKSRPELSKSSPESDGSVLVGSWCPSQFGYGSQFTISSSRLGLVADGVLAGFRNAPVSREGTRVLIGYSEYTLTNSGALQAKNATYVRC